MKNIARILMLILSVALTSSAGPLQKQQVGADAKWLVHLDVDRLRSTKVGDFLINQVLAAKLGALTRQFEFDLDWQKVHALTAYGTSYQSKSGFDGVLLIKADLDLQSALDAAIEKSAQESKTKSAPIEKTQEGDVTTYSLKNHLFVTFKPGRPVVVGKSLDSVAKAGEVLSGTAANLASTKTFSEFPKPRSPFFFVATAEGFNPSSELAGGGTQGDEPNPKAKILKLANSGRVDLGEESDQLFLDVSLKAKSAEVVTQIKQVIQGMIALASLSQPDNQDLQQLAQSAKVSSSGNFVTLKLGYPTDQAVLFLSHNLNKHAEHKKHQRMRSGEDQEMKNKSESDGGSTEPAEAGEK